MIEVTVLLFAVLRERRGASRELRQVAPGTTAAQLYAQLFPPGPRGLLPVAFVVDGERVTGSTPLSDGCELALLPPLGGG